MKRIKFLTALFAAALLSVALPAIASAQYGQSDPYSRNGGYNNGGIYGNAGYSDMRSTLRDLKSRANQLQRQVDRELDRSRINGSYREDQVNQLARNFKNAVQNLDTSYNNRNDNEVHRVMDTASQLDRAISRSGMSYQVTNQWQAIRSDLRTLGINYNTGRGRNTTGRYGNGNYNTGKPSWWPF